MTNREDYIFWRLASFFITVQRYRIIQLFENQKELWLEKLENKHAPIVRLFMQDLNWSNAMQRDIEFTSANGENVRKQVKRNDLNVLNIYISQYPPVDEYDDRLAKPYLNPDGNKTSVHSVLFANGEYESSFEKLSKIFGKNISIDVEEPHSDEDVELLKKSTLEFALNAKKKEREAFGNGRPLFTYLFIAVQVVVFIWLELHGGSTNNATLIKYGAKSNLLIYEGEWWRLITPIFLHIGFLHLAMNTLALYFLGTAVERIYGNARFAFIYLLAGVAGFIASFIFSANISAGASGAIYGCFGALLLFSTIYPRLFFRTMGTNVIIVLIINLVFSFSATGIDTAGHLGGLLGGFLAAGIVQVPNKKKLALQAVYLLLTIGLIWGSLTYGFHSPEAYFTLSYSELQKGKIDEAKINLQKAVQLNPNFHEAYYNLAIISLKENNLKQAKQFAEKAADLNPNDQQYSDLVKQINQHLQSSGGGK